MANESGTTPPATPGRWESVWTFLEGKKTYLVAILGGLYLFGGDQGWWQVNEALLGILGFGGLAALRAGKKKD
jgi:hypothetical protein